MPISTIKSTEGDINLQAVQAKATSTAAGAITLDSAKDVNLLTQTTTTYASTHTTKKDVAWQSVKGSGSNDQDTHYTTLNTATPNGLAIKLGTAESKITAGMSVRDSAAILSKEPGMEWMATLMNDPALSGKVNWAAVEEAHQQWAYGQQGLTPAAAAVVSMLVIYFTAGAGSGLVGTTTATATGSVTTLGGITLSTTVGGVTTTTALGAIINAGVSTLASQAAVSTINNGGNIGKVLDELGSSQNMRSLLASMISAGALNGINGTQFMQQFKGNIRTDGLSVSTFSDRSGSTKLDNEISKTLVL